MTAIECSPSEPYRGHQTAIGRRRSAPWLQPRRCWSEVARNVFIKTRQWFCSWCLCHYLRCA